MTGCIYALLKDVDYSQIAGAVVLQHFLGLFWYGLVFSSIWSYYLAADKGVKKIDHVVKRYGNVVCIMGSVVAAAVRAIAIYFIVTATELETLCGYQEAAMCVAAIMIAKYHCDFWCQRPFVMMIIDGAFECAAAVSAGTMMFYLQANNISYKL